MFERFRIFFNHWNIKQVKNFAFEIAVDWDQNYLFDSDFWNNFSDSFDTSLN